MGFGPPPPPPPQPGADPGLVLLASLGEPASAPSIDLQNLDTSGYDVLKLFFFILRSSATGQLVMRFNGDVGPNYNTERLNWNSGGVTQNQFLNQSRLILTFGLAEFTSHPATGDLTIFQQGIQTQKYVVGNVTHLGSTSGNLLSWTHTGRWLAGGVRITRIQVLQDGGGTFTSPRAWLFGVRRQ